MKSSPPERERTTWYVKATSTIVQTAKNIIMTKKKHPHASNLPLRMGVLPCVASHGSGCAVCPGRCFWWAGPD